MHLLRRETNGEFSLADYDDRQLPPYAILSHTWGSDNDEVSFKDIVKGRGKEKQGYAKLHFCANQAANDGLEYFWVDTCCIDKKDSVELSKAINSMFSWYQHSTRCYVYLSDVAAAPRTPWNAAFQKSKWFTRGWTLQELLAPSSVEFFTVDGERLGDKQTLSQAIRQATAISSRALETSPLHLSDFSIEERMSWAAGRETKREEDAIYSLLGLFDVHMPPIYGEGKSNASDRLELEIQRKLALDSSRKRSAEEAFETTLLEESNPKLKQSASDRAQEHSVAMQGWWAGAIARNMGKPRGYAKVAVLLLRWADELDDLRTSDEVNELAHVFRECFHFETDVVELNHRSKPQHQMDRVLTTFVETYDQPNNLLIVFYTGYAIHHENASRLEFSPFLRPSTARVTSTGGQINWYKTEEFLRSDAVDGDVLAILDTPYAIDGNIRHASNDESDSNYRDQGTTRRLQLINTYDHRPPSPASLTRALIDGLQKLHERNGSSAFSTQDLHQCIEMDPRRSGLSSEMWSLLQNKRHILLTPMNQSGHDTSVLQQRRRRPGRGYLTLGLEIRDASLEKEQIDRLASILSTSLDNQMIGLRGIEWLGFERREKALLSFSEHLSLKVRAVAQWRRIIAMRKAERAALAHQALLSLQGSANVSV